MEQGQLHEEQDSQQMSETVGEKMGPPVTNRDCQHLQGTVGERLDQTVSERSLFGSIKHTQKVNTQ